MAIEKQIIIDVNSTDAQKNLKKVTSQFEGLGEEATKSIKNIEKGVENTEKSTKSLANGFKATGVAIKAMGIGLVISAFNVVKDLFQSNQVIADKFGATFKALSIAFNDFFDYVTKNAEGVVTFFKNIFENPLESLKEFGNLIKENIIERFESALEVAGFLSDALMKLFEGDFAGALDSIKEAGKEMVDVYTGIDDTVGKVSELATAAANYAKETFKAAEGLQAQENAAKRAAAVQAGLVEQYDRQAEKLRQIRDNDLISIDERIKANNDLGKVLEEQEKAMLAQANLQVQAAQNQYNLNKSIENEVALIDARNNVKGVEAQIEGFRSEQISNRIALEKEAIDLTKTRTEAETTLALEQKRFNAELEKDELKKLDVQRQILEEEKRIELERLQFNIDSYAEGTQARLNAQIEFDAKKQELDNALIENQRATAAEELAIEQAKAEQKRAIQQQGLDTALQGVGLIKGLFEKSKGVQKAAIIAESAIGVGKMIIANNLANVGALATPQAIASGGISAAATIAFNNISTGIGVAANLAATAKALQAVGGGGAAAGGGGASIGGGAPSAPAPQFNVVGNSGVNQLAQTLGSQQPVQAYVVASNVTTQQSLDRNIVNNASLG
jgi:hypothetical protein